MIWLLAIFHPRKTVTFHSQRIRKKSTDCILLRTFLFNPFLYVYIAWCFQNVFTVMYSVCSLVHSAIPDLDMSVMQPNVHEPETFVRHHIIYFQSIPDYSFDEKISIIREVQATIPPSRLLMERCSRTGQDGWRRPGAMRYSSARTRRR